MEKKTDDLFDEIIKNSRNDRKTVEDIRDTLVRVMKSDQFDDMSMPVVAVAENIAKLSDVLTKMNSQLLELAKVHIKRDSSEDSIDKDKDSIFEEIEMSGTSTETN